jgi:exopolysaccharide production protein ExoZ
VFSSPSQRRRYAGVQALRFVAALLVVCAHLPSYLRDRAGLAVPDIPTGQLGVTVFFAISGFVAVLTTRTDRPGGARRFLRRRIARIVPLAWLVLTVKLVTGLIAPGLLERFRPDGWYVLASYLFLPARGPDGIVQPLYTVMWTLSFELYFYGVVTVALAVRRTPLTVVAPVMTVLACASAFRPEHWPTWQFFADPYVLLFVVGMVLGHVATGTATSGTVAWGVVAVAVWTTVELAASHPVHSVVLLPAATVVLAVTLWSEPWIPARLAPSLDLLGDASYALYLTHPLVAPATVAVLATVLPSATRCSRWLPGRQPSGSASSPGTRSTARSCGCSPTTPSPADGGQVRCIEPRSAAAEPPPAECAETSRPRGPTTGIALDEHPEERHDEELHPLREADDPWPVHGGEADGGIRARELDQSGEGAGAGTADVLHARVRHAEQRHPCPGSASRQVGVLCVEEELLVEGSQVSEQGRAAEECAAGDLLDGDHAVEFVVDRRLQEAPALDEPLDAEVPVEHRVRVDGSSGEHGPTEQRARVRLRRPEERGDGVLRHRRVRVQEQDRRGVHDRERRVDRTPEPLVQATADDDRAPHRRVAQVRESATVVDEDETLGDACPGRRGHD